MKFGWVAVESHATLLKRAKALLQTLGECAADGHRLAHALHLCAKHAAGARQLLERPARDLGDDVVDARLEAGRRHLGDVVGDLVERVPNGEFRRDLGDGKASCLRCQRRRPRHAWVHFDDNLVAVEWVHCELHIGSAGLDTDSTDTGKRCVAHALVLDITERLRWSHRDRVAGVYAHWIEVLDRADDDAVVVAVTHDFEFVFFPAGDAGLNQNLADGAARNSLTGQVCELFECRCDTGAAATKDVGRTNDAWKANGFEHLDGFVESVSNATRWHIETDLDHRLLELLAIFGCGNCLCVCADELRGSRHTNETALEQGHCNVERSLTTHRWEHCVGTLALNNARHDLGSEWLDVRGIGEIGVGHDGGRIRVREDDAVALFAQHSTRLSAAVVELACLPDYDRATADNQNAVDVRALWHQATPNSACGSPSVRTGVARRTIGRSRHEMGSSIMSSNMPNK
ncbi:unannotated protein [freshwater metagenome]|uniref:Unannotated protein n=1 Tax=freshwater metagenome TaxID=449393 RepID=A0A6J6XGQ9_9ZZZZ